MFLNELGTSHADAVATYAAVPAKEFVRLFWTWFDQHAGEVIFRKRILFFSVALKVGDLAPVFVRIFGPRPA